jgi:hypothetical protein
MTHMPSRSGTRQEVPQGQIWAPLQRPDGEGQSVSSQQGLPTALPVSAGLQTPAMASGGKHFTRTHSLPGPQSLGMTQHPAGGG